MASHRERFEDHMSDQPTESERVCKLHCGHDPAHFEGGVCWKRVGLGFCRHKCADFSPQPSEKHEFIPTPGPNGTAICDAAVGLQGERQNVRVYCGQPREAKVHQPSAVQAPEQATPRPWRYEIEHDWLVGGPDDETVFHIADDSTSPNKANAELIVLAVNNFEAQAVRIAELEDALKPKEGK
jgi:hypothetical protein